MGSVDRGLIRLTGSSCPTVLDRSPSIRRSTDDAITRVHPRKSCDTRVLFLCSISEPFLRPDLGLGWRRAEPRSRLAAGHRRRRARSRLEGVGLQPTDLFRGEHDARLGPVGAGLIRRTAPACRWRDDGAPSPVTLLWSVSNTNIVGRVSPLPPRAPPVASRPCVTQKRDPGEGDNAGVQKRATGYGGMSDRPYHRKQQAAAESSRISCSPPLCGCDPFGDTLHHHALDPEIAMRRHALARAGAFGGLAARHDRQLLSP
jgi:hypothetical protein